MQHAVTALTAAIRGDPPQRQCISGKKRIEICHLLFRLVFKLYGVPPYDLLFRLLFNVLVHKFHR